MTLINWRKFLLLLFSVGNFAAFAQPATASYHQLPLKEYNTLIKILTAANEAILRDTVVIHYQYPHSMQADSGTANDEIIQQNTTAELRWLHEVMARRKNISVLYIAGPGEAGTLLKNYNNLVTEDTGNKIHQLIFKNNSRANSVMLLPDRQCLLLNSQDGWAALQLSAADINKILLRDAPLVAHQ